jgi:hypothetical protein
MISSLGDYIHAPFTVTKGKRTIGISAFYACFVPNKKITDGDLLHDSIASRSKNNESYTAKEKVYVKIGKEAVK